MIGQKDIYGELHVHSKYSDGRPMEEAVLRAVDHKYKWIGFSDHAVVMGMNQVKSQRVEMDGLEAMFGIKIYQGLEVDINLEGRLECDSQILDGLDYVIASVHEQPGAELFRRYSSAIDSARVTIIGHPTGYKADGSGAKALDILMTDWEKIFRLAANSSVYLEINGKQDRMDLPESKILWARNLGCKFVLSSDDHEGTLLDIERAVEMANRVGLDKKDVLNCQDIPQLKRRV